MGTGSAAPVWSAQFARPAWQVVPDFARPGLPLSRPRSVVYSPKHRLFTLKLDVEISSRIKALASASPGLVFTTLAAGLLATLARYGQWGRLGLGCPALAGSGPGSANDACGLMVVDVSPEASFQDLLSQTRTEVVAVCAAKDTTYRSLLSALNISAAANQCSVFAVAVAMDGFHGSMPDLKQDVTIRWRDDGSLSADIYFDSRILDETAVTRFAECYATLLASAVADINASVAGLRVLGNGHRELLKTWQHGVTASSDVSTILDIFARSVATAPEGAALLHEGRILSFKELDDRSTQLARLLSHSGVARGSRVGLACERVPELPIAILAIVKCGAAYVPLDPALPSARLAKMIDLAAVTLIVATHSAAAKLGGLCARLIPFDHAAGVDVDEPKAVKRPRPGRDDLAYIMFTSGSTGEPKAVGMRHGPLCNLVEWECHRLQPGRTLQWAAAGFDVSAQELFATWGAGAAIVIMTEHERRDIRTLPALLAKAEITNLFVPAAILDQLASACLQQNSFPERLQVVTTAGESLRVTKNIMRMFRRLPGCELRNQYGPTETHVVTEHRLAGMSSRWDALPPIGGPIQNARVYLLDESLSLVPPGGTGEIYVGGEVLARGYIDRPDLTAERFLPDPFSDIPGARIYRTGDLARHSENGELQFIGRADRQLKVRGYRVEPGEIETTLRGHPAVADVAVVQIEDDAVGTELAAYVVTTGPDLRSTQLRTFVAGLLPAYMVPRWVMFLPALPLNVNGKVDRNELRNKRPWPDDVAEAAVSAFTQTEDIIAGLWRRLLRLGSLSRHDSFFEVGGHSLLGMQLLARIRDTFGLDLNLRLLFECPRLEDFAARIDLMRRHQSGVPSLPAIRPRSSADRAMMSSAQKRLWFLHQLEPDNVGYNIQAGIRIRGEINEHLIGDAFNEVIERHEVLRTAFGNVDGIPVPKLVDVEPLYLRKITVDGEESSQMEAVRQIAVAEVGRPFRLSEPPLLRPVLIILGRDDHVLLVTMHHIVSDGWSMNILFSDLAEAYRALRVGARGLSALTVQFSDVALWEESELVQAAIERQLGFWRNLLSPLWQPLILGPANLPAVSARSMRGRTIAFDFDKRLCQDLSLIAQESVATLFIVLLAAYAAFLQRLSGSEDLVIGVPVAGRQRAETHTLIGFFVNMLPLRLKPKPTLRFRDFLVEVRDLAIAAFDHQDVSLDRLVGELKLPGRSLFQTVFMMQNTPPVGSGFVAEDLQTARFECDEEVANYELIVELLQIGSGLRCNLTYACELHAENTVRRWMVGYERVLRAVAADADISIGALDVGIL